MNLDEDEGVFSGCAYSNLKRRLLEMSLNITHTGPSSSNKQVISKTSALSREAVPLEPTFCCTKEKWGEGGIPKIVGFWQISRYVRYVSNMKFYIPSSIQHDLSAPFGLSALHGEVLFVVQPSLKGSPLLTDVSIGPVVGKDP